ncbi:N,N'-diacetylchitobiose-specific phosphotransferase enzyme IIA component [Serratia odorifera]|jgi:cellobiose PTS system EIIA component|nr:N,N'-diacetylchitobiose-specific phosphotransferase enzyme IIA component [Serratia odorifera]
MSEAMAADSPDFESTIMELLVLAGSARSSALMALQQARAGEFNASAAHMADSKEAVQQAHRIQTRLISLDEGCGKLPINLITVHAQDHLMNAMVIQDLADDMIELFRRQAQRETAL